MRSPTLPALKFSTPLPLSGDVPLREAGWYLEVPWGCNRQHAADHTQLLLEQAGLSVVVQHRIGGLLIGASSPDHTVALNKRRYEMLIWYAVWRSFFPVRLTYKACRQLVP